MPDSQDCTYCGNSLVGEELENPFVDGDDVLCDECHTEHYEFTCCFCQEYGDNAHRDEYMVSFGDGNCTYSDCDPSGLYRRYRNGYPDGRGLPIYDYVRIGDAPDTAVDFDGEGHGHLCFDCWPMSWKKRRKLIAWWARRKWWTVRRWFREPDDA